MLKKGDKIRKGKFLSPQHFEKKRITAELFVGTLSECLNMGVEELRKMANDTTLSGMKMAMVRAMLRSAEKGDYDTLEKMGQRMIGKVPEQIKFEDTTDSAEKERMAKLLLDIAKDPTKK